MQHKNQYWIDSHKNATVWKSQVTVDKVVTVTENVGCFFMKKLSWMVELDDTNNNQTEWFSNAFGKVVCLITTASSNE